MSSSTVAMSEIDSIFMKVALAEARIALSTREVPVGCAFVSAGRVIARAHNATNATFNATRHAEMVALDHLIEDSRRDLLFDAAGGEGFGARAAEGAGGSPLLSALRTRLAQATLYVTVEPCIMCADALRISGVARVVFGCANEKFGGAGTVMNVLARQGGPTVVAGVSTSEAISLLKRFYGRANPAAPVSGRVRNAVDDEEDDACAAVDAVVAAAEVLCARVQSGDT